MIFLQCFKNLGAFQMFPTSSPVSTSPDLHHGYHGEPSPEPLSGGTVTTYGGFLEWGTHGYP